MTPDKYVESAFVTRSGRVQSQGQDLVLEASARKGSFFSRRGRYGTSPKYSECRHPTSMRCSPTSRKWNRPREEIDSRYFACRQFANLPQSDRDFWDGRATGQRPARDRKSRRRSACHSDKLPVPATTSAYWIGSPSRPCPPLPMTVASTP